MKRDSPAVVEIDPRTWRIEGDDGIARRFRSGERVWWDDPYEGKQEGTLARVTARAADVNRSDAREVQVPPPRLRGA